MDVNIIYNKIVEKLEHSDSKEIITGLENCMASATTGSEALMLSASYLHDLKNNNPKIYTLIKNDVKDYLKYCKLKGLIIN
jgi:hypothetical protein